MEKKNKMNTLSFTFFNKTENDDLLKILDKDKKTLFELLYKANVERCTYKEIKDLITSKSIGLDEKSFQQCKELQKEKDDFLDNPFDVTEGIVSCPKCFKNKTFSYSKQVRSSDEGFTTFNLCISCNNKWRINQRKKK